VRATGGSHPDHPTNATAGWPDPKGEARRAALQAKGAPAAARETATAAAAAPRAPEPPVYEAWEDSLVYSLYRDLCESYNASTPRLELEAFGESLLYEVESRWVPTDPTGSRALEMGPHAPNTPQLLHLFDFSICEGILRPQDEKKPESRSQNEGKGEPGCASGAPTGNREVRPVAAIPLRLVSDQFGAETEA
jgi:hypothetical protein